MTTQTPGRDGHRSPVESGRCSSQAIDIEMTSVTDGLTHAITAADFDAGIWLGQGRYRAACGTPVIVAGMSSKPGPRCRQCPPASPPDMHCSGVLARLIAALSSR
jgi:hypothetical protein